jgi:hypothetical protein
MTAQFVIEGEMSCMCFRGGLLRFEDNGGRLFDGVACSCIENRAFTGTRSYCALGRGAPP